MTFCQNFHWLLFSPKKTKNKWHLNQNAALSKTLVRQSPSNRFTSLSLQLWMNHWSFTNMHNSFCAGGKGVKVDIINILYVNFSFFSWGGGDVMRRSCQKLPIRKNQEKPGKHVQLFAHQGELSWECVRFDPLRQPSKFGVPNGLPGDVKNMVDCHIWGSIFFVQKKAARTQAKAIEIKFWILPTTPLVTLQEWNWKLSKISPLRENHTSSILELCPHFDILPKETTGLKVPPTKKDNYY